MFDLAYLENLNHLWREKVLTLSKSDIKYIEGRTDFRSTLQGFLTRDYYQRSKVIKQGEIVYGYAFQDWTNDVTKLKHDYPVWVLSSPSSEVNQNPTIYREIIKNIEDLKRKSDLLEEENKFLNLIKKPLSDAKMVELPSSINNGKLIYLSIVYRRLNNAPSFHLGLNLYLMCPSVSKELLFLPLKYCSEDYRQGYEPNGYPL